MAMLQVGTTDLQSCLDTMGAPMMVRKDEQGDGMELLWLWEETSAWGFFISIPTGSDYSPSLNWADRERHPQFLRRTAGDVGTGHAVLIAMINVAADRQIVDQACEWLQALFGIGFRGCPMSVADNARLEAGLPGEVYTSDECVVIKKGFPAFEVDPLDGAQRFGLLDNVLDGLQGHRAGL